MRIVAIAAQPIRWSIAGEGSARGRTERAAVLLEVRSDRGCIGLGEAAPLPGMSIDTLDQAERALAAFAALAPFELSARNAAGGHAPAERRDQASAPSSAVGYLSGEPTPFQIRDQQAAHAFATAPLAARFAIETALCDVLARDRGISLSALLRIQGNGAAATGETATPSYPHAARTSDAITPPYAYAALRAAQIAGARQASREPRTVPIAAVVDDAGAARRAFAAGIRCFKIKLGADETHGRLRAIAGAVPGAMLRIDANRSWPRTEVPARLAALADLPIDYVEEPCRDAHRLLGSVPLACKLALDESLAAISLDDLLAALRSPDLAAVILKPTLLGGLSVALELAALARRFDVMAIASHALEGPVGTAACAELALALAAHRPPPPAAPPAGLAAHPALAGWRVQVAQIAPDHVHPAGEPGLGFTDLDLAGIVQACGTRLDEAHPP